MRRKETTYPTFTENDLSEFKTTSRERKTGKKKIKLG